MTALHKRRCGPCTACCVSLKIEAPELAKKAGEPCRHLKAGCGIYEGRPGVCREFLCGWRLFEEFGDDWRPDLSGVLMMRKAPSELPPAWQGGPYGVHMVIIGGEAAVRRPAFAEQVARLVARNIPVVMSASSPSTLVNEHLTPATDLHSKLLELYALLHAARWERGYLRMIPSLYRLLLDRQYAKLLSRSNG